MGQQFYDINKIDIPYMNSITKIYSNKVHYLMLRKYVFLYFLNTIYISRKHEIFLNIERTTINWCH